MLSRILNSARRLPIHRIRMPQISSYSLIPSFLKSDKPQRGFDRFKKDYQQDDKNKGNNDPKPPRKPNFNPRDPKFIQLLGLGAAGILCYYLLQQHSEPVPDITFQELLSKYIETGMAKTITVEVTKKKLPLTNIYVIGSSNQRLALLKVPDVTSFLKNLEYEQFQLGIERQRLIPVEYKEKTDKDTEEIMEDIMKFGGYAINFILIGSLIYVLYRMSGGSNTKNSQGFGGGLGDIFQMSKPNAKVYSGEQKINVRFNDVAGLKEAKKEIMEFVEFLKNPEKFKALGARIPRGALLCGSPGTGKTLLAKATAGEAGVPFFSISGSDFVEMFVGVGASRVRQLFKQARERAPSIIFIDEIDAVGRKRFGRFGGNDERDNTLNQLLTEMDGFTTDVHVVVMGGTNRRDILDPALLRPGRFDRTVELQLPDLEGRQEILKIHLKPLKLNEEVSLEDYAKRLAALSPGFSGADLENLCNEAAILAARRDKTSIDKSDFESASEKVIGGLERSKQLSLKEKRTVAYHEAGHAVAGWFLAGADPILKVSILPRSKGALGFAQMLPNETSLYSKEELFDKIVTILGGRVAEEIFMGTVTTGAADDFQKATAIATRIVTNFGMNDVIGMVGYNLEQEQMQKPFSEDTNRLIDIEVRKIIDDCVLRCRALLREKRELVEALALKLLEKERVTHRDLVEVLGQRPYESSEEYQKYVQESS